MTEHWTVAYKAELATMTQAEWEADLAQFAEHLVQWETGKPLTLSGMSKSMRDRGRAVKAEAIRRGQPERIPAVFVADIPEEKEKAAKPKTSVTHNPAMEQHIENLSNMLNKAGVKLTADQLEQLKAKIVQDYEKYPRTPLRNRRVTVYIHNSDKTLVNMDGIAGCFSLQCTRTSQGNDGLLTLEVHGYNS
jgi:hypothetical protein